MGETSSTMWEEEKKWDVDSFNNIMAAIQLDITFEGAAAFSRRLGRRTEGRSRPLLVGLHNENTRNLVLQHANRLRSTNLSNVSIAPDLTQQQREADDALREEAIRRNNNLSEQDRAKNLRWVVVGRKGTRRLIKKTSKDHDHPPVDQNKRKRPRDTTAADSAVPGSRRPRVSTAATESEGEEDEEEMSSTAQEKV